MVGLPKKVIMIYTDKVTAVFDDSTVRGIDKIVDRLITPLYNDQLQLSLGLDRYLSEYKSAFLSVPRQSGKSTYLSRAADCFDNPLIIANSYNRNLYRNHTRVSSLEEIKSKIRGCRFYYSAVLADEIDFSLVRSIIKELLVARAVDKNTIVLALSTS